MEVSAFSWRRKTEFSALVEVNPGLAANPVSHHLGENKAIKSSVVQSLSVLLRTEEVGGFGIFLATTKAAGGAKCEVDTIFFTSY